MSQHRPVRATVVSAGSWGTPIAKILADPEVCTEVVLHARRSQASPAFRAEFLRTLEVLDDLRWWLNPSTGVVHTRLPCPTCGWAEKRAERTRLVRLDGDGAVFSAICHDHGPYELCIDPM